MQYMGSKNRFAKEIIPIIQSYIDRGCNGYLEPFVGGANVIDKIKCDKRYGCDVNEYLIALLEKTRDDVSEFPNFILKERYDMVKKNKNEYPFWEQGLIGFCSFGNKFWNGYASNGKNDKTGERTKSYFSSLKTQSPFLKGVVFKTCSFKETNKNLNGYVIYCDPPYKGTTKYKTDEFPYDEYYDWCREMSKNNIVICSEYNMPDDFECIWEKETKVNFDSNRNSNDEKDKRTEKMFMVKGGLRWNHLKLVMK